MANDHRLTQNVVWNLLGTGLPLVVAIVAIPILIAGMGTERFGVLTLAWMVVGYFSLFDFGIGRALTKLLAEKLGLGAHENISALIWTSLLLMAALGVVGATIFALITPWLVGGILKIPAELESETTVAFYLLASSVPIVVTTSGLRGVIEANQRFGLVNAVRLPLGLATFLFPVAVLTVSDSLIPIVASLVLARFIAFIAHVVLCFHVVPELKSEFVVDRGLVSPLVRFGGWMTVSNVVSPLMVYLDRFFVGATLSMTAVAHYTTPYEVVTKLLIIPRAIMGVLFPAFASALASDRDLARGLFARWRNYLVAALFPLTLVITTFAYDIMSLWLGQEFAEHSAIVLRWLAAGVFINALSQLAFGLVQSAGRPDVTAKIHVVELPFYLLALWWLIKWYGIEGAAVAWVLRVAVDALLLFGFSQFYLGQKIRPSWNIVLGSACALFVLGAGGLVPGLGGRLIYVSIVLSLFVPIVWLYLLAPEDKRTLRKWAGASVN